MDNILQLTSKLISLPSTVDNKKALHQCLEIMKYELSDVTCEVFEKNGVRSLLFMNTPKRVDKFDVILNAHLDVVSAKSTAYTPRMSNGRLYGRGAYDMKAAAVVEMIVFRELAKQLKYPIALQIVTDEEIGGANGTKYQIEKGVNAKFVIAGEGTDFRINNESKGILWIKLKTTGKAAHAAYLWKGQNALSSLMKDLEAILRAYPIPHTDTWQTTVNIAHVSTPNTTFNAVPDYAEALLDIRFIPTDESKLLSTLHACVSKTTEIEIITKESVHFTDPVHKGVRALQEAIKNITDEEGILYAKNGGSDIRFYNNAETLGTGVTFGPIGQGRHADNEWVDIKSLENYYHVLKTFLATF